MYIVDRMARRLLLSSCSNDSLISPAIFEKQLTLLSGDVEKVSISAIITSLQQYLAVPNHHIPQYLLAEAISCLANLIDRGKLANDALLIIQLFETLLTQLKTPSLWWVSMSKLNKSALLVISKHSTGKEIQNSLLQSAAVVFLASIVSYFDNGGLWLIVKPSIDHCAYLNLLLHELSEYLPLFLKTEGVDRTWSEKAMQLIGKLLVSSASITREEILINANSDAADYSIRNLLLVFKCVAGSAVPYSALVVCLLRCGVALFVALHAKQSTLTTDIFARELNEAISNLLLEVQSSIQQTKYICSPSSSMGQHIQLLSCLALFSASPLCSLSCNVIHSLSLLSENKISFYYYNHR